MNDDRDRFYVAEPDVSVRLSGKNGGAILFHPNIAQNRLLNGSGLFVWEKLQTGLCVRELADALTSQFSCPSIDTVLKDTSAFLQDLCRAGFIKETVSTATPATAIETYPHEEDAPQAIDISITGKCNLRCKHCFYASERERRPDLTAGPWLTFFEEIGKLGVREVCLTGGEVFMRSDLWELIDSIVSNRMRYSILTNGTLVSEKTLEELRKGKRFVRLNSIQVSIDGSNSDVHDRLRGRGAFERAARGIRLLREAGMPVTSRVTINRYNADDLEEIARFLLEEIGIHDFSTNEVMHVGAGCRYKHELSLRPEQELDVMRRLSRIAERHKGRVTAMAGPLAKWKTYRTMEHARASGEQSAPGDMGYLTACGGVFTKLAVHHDGVITPCHLLPDVVVGNIGQALIKEIWRNHSALEALRNRRRIPMAEVDGCTDCEWNSYCNGGCPGLARPNAMAFNRANPQDCYRIFRSATGGVN